MAPATRRRAVRAAIAVVVLAAAGVALAASSDATAADVAGIVLVGIALVGAVAWVFFEVGRSEDAERAHRHEDGG